MVVVGRHINGITINPLEYILNDNEDVMKFETQEVAITFLKNNGISDEEINWLVFKEIN